MARQKLGQHFLSSSGILEKIARAACGERVELAVEIGPGRGALTGHLLGHADRVLGLEIDRSLIEILHARWPDEPRLEIRHTDALSAVYSQFGDGILAGNLPYYAATALISRYLRDPGQLRHGVFLIQKEVANRIVASPRSKDYGYFSVECQFLADAEYLFSVPPGAFHPPPKVDSAVIRLRPRARPDRIDTDKFLSFVSACFRQKRKTLRNNLSSRFTKEVLITLPGMGRRAEELALPDFTSLFQAAAQSSTSDVV